MGYIYYNPNPKGKNTTDCVIRALMRVNGLSWMDTYYELTEIVKREFEMPSANVIWEEYLLTHGFKKSLLPNHCPACMTIREFSNVFNDNIYIACTGSHVVAVMGGNYFDAWDSGDEVVSYFFEIERMML